MGIEIGAKAARILIVFNLHRAHEIRVIEQNSEIRKIPGKDFALYVSKF
jgi:hypothetical protein